MTMTMAITTITMTMTTTDKQQIHGAAEPEEIILAAVKQNGKVTVLARGWQIIRQFLVCWFVGGQLTNSWS